MGQTARLEKESPVRGLSPMTEITHSSPEEIAVMTNRAREVVRLHASG